MLNLAVRVAPIHRKWYGNFILTAKPLANATPTPVPQPYRHKWAGPEDVAIMNAHPEADQPGAYPRRVARGDRCVCLLNGDELVGYQWMAFESARASCEDLPPWEILFLPLTAKNVYLYDLYVYKKHRGKGLGPLIRALAFAELRALGYQAALAIVDVHNEPALRVRLRTGEELLQIMYCYHIGKWKRCFFGRAGDPGLKRWWDRFGATQTRHGGEPSKQ
jgi:GNAT superfamily N-acetyltransferase